MATQTIRIIVEERGSKQAASNIRGVASASNEAQKALNLLQGALAAIGVTSLVRQYVELSNTYQTLQNRIRLVTASQAEQTAVSRELLNIANQTYTSLEATTELYARLAFNTRELGLTQREVLGVTKALNQAVILSGAGLREATNAIIQLSQGLASGTLRGDELRSVLEQLPYVADVVARGMGVTRDELRRLAAEGEVTTKVVVDTIRDAAPEIEESFSKLTPTIAQAFTVLNNSLLDFVGNANNATGLSALLARTLLFLAENVEIVIVVIGLLSVALATLAIRSTVLALSQMISALLSTTIAVKALTIATAAFNAVLAVNPFVLIALGITVVIGLLFGLNEIMSDTTDTADQLNKTISGADPDAINKSVGGYMRIRDELLRQEDILERQLDTRELQAKVEDEIHKLDQQLVQDQIRLSASQREELDLLIRSNAERRLSNELTQQALDKQQQVQDQIRQQLRGPGLSREQDQATTPLINARLASGLPFDDDFNTLLDKIRNSVRLLNQLQFEESLNNQNREIRNQIALLNESVEVRQREGAILKITQAAQEAGVELTEQQIEKTRRLYDDLRFLSIDDAIAQQAQAQERANAVQRLRLQGKEAEADIQQFLNTLLAEGESIESINLDNLRQQVAERQRLAAMELDKTFNRDLDDQFALLRANSTQRQIEATIIQRRNEYERQGLEYTKEKERLDRERLTLLDEETRKQQLLTQVFGDRVAMEQRLADLQRLRSGEQDFGRARGLRAQEIDAERALRQGDQSFEAGFLNGLGEIEKKVMDVSGGVEQALTNAFSSAEDALVQFVQTGEFNFSGFVDSILADITRLLARQAVLALFSAFGGGAGLFSLFGLSGARAAGGPVTQGESYLVGENGPEIFQPNQSGMILPNGVSPAAAPQTNITVVNVTDPKMVSAALNDPDSQQVIVNVIGKNRQAINRALGNG